MKAVLYCRVSSKEQEQEGFSLDAQEKMGRDYARSQRIEIIREWKVSESAWSKGRDKFDQMIEYVRRHTDVEHVIFDCLDRMTRNDFDKLKIAELVKECGKTIHFARTRKTISASSGSDDEFLVDIEVAVAKKWSNDISRKASMGMKEKAEQGFYPGLVPLGYLNDKASGDIRLDPERASLVARGFELMASGQCSLSILSGQLYAIGLRSKAGYRVQKSTLEQMLKNPFYYGSFVWKGQIYRGSHSALISKQLFDAANDALTGRGHPAKPRLNGYLFNNLATCGICGCKIVGEKKKGRYQYYHCTFSKGRHSGVPYIPETQFIDLFEDSVRRVTISNDRLSWLRDVLDDFQKDRVKLIESRVAGLAKQKTLIEDRLSRLYDFLCDGKFAPEVFSCKESEYRTGLAGVISELQECEQNRASEVGEALEIFELANRLYPTYLDFEPEKKAKMLRVLASNYSLNGLTICATYRKPISLLVDLPPRPIKLPRLDSNQRPAD